MSYSPCPSPSPGELYLWKVDLVVNKLFYLSCKFLGDDVANISKP